MNENMAVEAIQDPIERKIAYESARGKIGLLEETMSEMNSQKQQIERLLSEELNSYEVDFNKNQEREISHPEFAKIDQEHRHKIDQLNLKKLSLEREIESRRNTIQRLWCLCWLLKMPYGAKEVKVTRNDTGEKLTVSREDVYNKYFRIVMNSEKSRLINEQSFLRLQLDFNNIPEFLVHPENEFYAENFSTSEKLASVKDQLEVLHDYERQAKGKYTGMIDCSSLVIGDFMNDNSEHLFNQLFLGSEEDKKGRAM